MGMLLSNHRRAKELSDSLWSLKEMFLVSFFLLLVAFRLRACTSFLTVLTLTAYSEFGLIVAAGVLPEWVVPLAVAVSFSFVIAAPLNRFAHPPFQRWENRLRRFERPTMHPDEQPKDLGGDNDKAASHQEAGCNVFFTDAEDSNFWRGLKLDDIAAAVLAMDDIEAKLIATRMLRERGFAGPIVSHALFEEHVQRIRDAGATFTYLTMSQAGVGLADQVLRALDGSEVARVDASMGA